MNGPVVQRPNLAASIFGAASAATVAISVILLAVDFLNYSAFNPVHLAALGVAALLAGLIGTVGRGATPWFGWLSYGFMMGSAPLVLGLGAAVLRAGTLPHDLTYRAVLGTSLFVLVLAIPVVVYVRRQAKATRRAI